MMKLVLFGLSFVCEISSCMNLNGVQKTMDSPALGSVHKANIERKPFNIVEDRVLIDLVFKCNKDWILICAIWNTLEYVSKRSPESLRHRWSFIPKVKRKDQDFKQIQMIRHQVEENLPPLTNSNKKQQNDAQAFDVLGEEPFSDHQFYDQDVFGSDDIFSFN